MLSSLDCALEVVDICLKFNNIRDVLKVPFGLIHGQRDLILELGSLLYGVLLVLIKLPVGLKDCSLKGLLLVDGIGMNALRCSSHLIKFCFASFGVLLLISGDGVLLFDDELHLLHFIGHLSPALIRFGGIPLSYCLLTGSRLPLHSFKLPRLLCIVSTPGGLLTKASDLIELPPEFTNESLGITKFALVFIIAAGD